jgi:maltose O-acetyltransferase
LFTGSHRLTDPKWQQKFSPIAIGDHAWIATNAIILPGVKIGKGALVGAGSVVRNDVLEYGIVFGNPAVIQHIKKQQFFRIILLFLMQNLKHGLAKIKISDTN